MCCYSDLPCCVWLKFFLASSSTIFLLLPPFITIILVWAQRKPPKPSFWFLHLQSPWKVFQIQNFWMSKVWSTATSRLNLDSQSFPSWIWFNVIVINFHTMHETGNALHAQRVSTQTGSLVLCSYVTSFADSSLKLIFYVLKGKRLLERTLHKIHVWLVHIILLNPFKKIDRTIR